MDGEHQLRYPPPGKFSPYRVSLPGLACRWKSHPRLCTPQTTSLLEKDSTPIYFSYLSSLCDVIIIVCGHFISVVQQSDSLCVSVWCWCYLCQQRMAEDHKKWLTALTWPKSFFSLLQCHCVVFVWSQPALLTLLGFDVLPWSECGTCQWNCRVREMAEWDSREAVTLTCVKKRFID